MSNCYLRGPSSPTCAAVLAGLILLLPTCPSTARSRVSRTPAEIERVQVQGRGRDATLRVGVTRPVRVVRSRLKGPERLVLEFSPARWKGPSQVAGKEGPVRSVRIGQHPGGLVRLVVDTGRRSTRWSGGFEGAVWVGRGKALKRVRPEQQASAGETRVRLRSLRGLTIGIDAGHGGSDPGAVSDCGLMEKKVTLKIAKLVRRLLRAEGVRVKMTRMDDRRLPLQSRIDFVADGGLDLIVSIHCDALKGSPHCTGITTYYHASSRRGRLLAEALQRRLPGATGLPDRGARPDDCLFKNGLYVLRNAACPAVLVETGYISSAPTARRLRDPGFRLQVARGIVDGLRQYVSSRPVRTARR